MIPCIRALYLRMYDECAARRAGGHDPNIWTVRDDEYAYMQQIQTAADLLNFTSDGTGRFEALAWDCAIAMGLSNWDDGSVAGDH